LTTGKRKNKECRGKGGRALSEERKSRITNTNTKKLAKNQGTKQNKKSPSGKKTKGQKGSVLPETGSPIEVSTTLQKKKSGKISSRHEGRPRKSIKDE